MDWTVYLLSICDNFRSVGVATTIVSVAAFLLWCVVRGLIYADAADDARRYKRRGDDKEAEDKMRFCEQIKIAGKLIFRVAVIAISIAAASTLMPTQRGVMRAYLMVEGAKVVNAPNAEKAMKGFTERVDRLIKAVEKK